MLIWILDCILCCVRTIPADHWFMRGSCCTGIMHAHWHRTEVGSLTVSVQYLQEHVMIFKLQVNDSTRAGVAQYSWRQTLEPLHHWCCSDTVFEGLNYWFMKSLNEVSTCHHMNSATANYCYTETESLWSFGTNDLWLWEKGWSRNDFKHWLPTMSNIYLFSVSCDSVLDFLSPPSGLYDVKLVSMVIIVG